jgi:CRP/FNR family cyclic AMP-dependent transcriptional regulator
MLTPVEDLLGRMPVFAGLSDEARGALAERLTRRPERRGSVVFVENEPGDRVFLILGGKMKISRRSTDGRENLLAVLGPGDIFGELSLFDPGPRTATATALTDVELASLEHSSLKPWRRLRRTNEAMGDLVFTDVPGRVAKQLLDLAERFGVPGSAGAVRVEHGLTQEELAQLVGASRETVNKSLADFATRGWLRLDSRAVILLDRERLARRAR